MTWSAVLSEQSARSRALAAALEPVIGSVYFAPEAHAAYVELGFAPSPGAVTAGGWPSDHWGHVALPDGIAYFASRGGILGQVRGEVVAAAFGVFNPDIVVPAVTIGWRIADADRVVAARARGAVAQLVRILGPAPAGLDEVTAALESAAAPLTTVGRPMFAGLRALPVPEDPIGRMWRFGDELREFRGDAHVTAFVASGFDGCQFQVLTERCAGMPPRSYAAGRGWSDEQLGSAESRLQQLGLLDGDQPTDAGRVTREAVETETDRLCSAMTGALGDGVVELVRTLQEWGAAIRAADGYYPSSPQEAVLAPAVNQWMVAHGLAPFGSSTTGR